MDKICYNGKYINKSELSLSLENRAFKYGDAFFETIRCSLGCPLFFEEHYFRMASSFFIMKMDIPLNFDMDFFQNLIHNLLIENNLQMQSARIRITFFRKEGGYYLPDKKSVNFIIESKSLNDNKYKLNENGFKVGLYKENYVEKNHLAQLKSTNRLLNILAAIYSRDNHYDDAILINNDKHVVESVSGNLFIINNQSILTPPIEDGCVDGVLRKVLLNNEQFQVVEKHISFSDLFNAEEVFITNVICGIQWVKKINNTIYQKKISSRILNMLNEKYLI